MLVLFFTRLYVIIFQSSHSCYSFNISEHCLVYNCLVDTKYACSVSRHYVLSEVFLEHLEQLKVEEDLLKFAWKKTDGNTKWKIMIPETI